MPRELEPGLPVAQVPGVQTGVLAVDPEVARELLPPLLAVVWEPLEVSPPKSARL